MLFYKIFQDFLNIKRYTDQIRIFVKTFSKNSVDLLSENAKTSPIDMKSYWKKTESLTMFQTAIESIFLDYKFLIQTGLLFFEQMEKRESIEKVKKTIVTTIIEEQKKKKQPEISISDELKDLKGSVINQFKTLIGLINKIKTKKDLLLIKNAYEKFIYKYQAQKSQFSKLSNTEKKEFHKLKEQYKNEMLKTSTQLKNNN